MARQHGSTSSGRPFDQATINAVWGKATPIPGQDPSTIRKDICGAIIEKAKHGDTKPNGTGWEIDHIYPVSRGGGDDLANLQPLQWENNRGKSDSLPGQWHCATSAK